MLLIADQRFIMAMLSGVCAGRERSELQSRVADLEREKAETASQVEELQHMARQRDLACDDSLRAGQDMAHDLDATLGLRARRFRASEAGLEEDSGIPRAAGKALSMTDCAGTWAMQGWTKALDAASGKAYFCPVKVMATGEPVWEIPNGGLVICCMPAVEMRRDEENIVRSTFMRKLVGAMIVVQFSVALCGAAFFEYNFGMLSKMIHALWPRW